MRSMHVVSQCCQHIGPDSPAFPFGGGKQLEPIANCPKMKEEEEEFSKRSGKQRTSSRRKEVIITAEKKYKEKHGCRQ